MRKYKPTAEINMLKAVIDTSVFVSGLIKSPFCRKIINALEKGGFLLVISPEILSELLDVISRPKFHNVINRETASRLAETIKVQSLLVNPPFKLDIINEDSDDNRFLEAALTAKANCIVSLDNHLLSLKSFRKIPIISPDAFLKLLEK